MSNLQTKARNRGRSNEYQLVRKLAELGHDDAERVPLSGALASLPGDVKVPSLSLLLEAKVYAVTKVEGARYARFDFNWLDKIEKEAKRVGYERGAVVFRGAKLSRDYVVIGLEDYVRLVETSTESVKKLQPEPLDITLELA